MPPPVGEVSSLEAMTEGVPSKGVRKGGASAPPFCDPPLEETFCPREGYLTQGYKGVLVPSGHRPGPTEPAGETGVPLKILLNLKLKSPSRTARVQIIS